MKSKFKRNPVSLYSLIEKSPSSRRELVGYIFIASAEVLIMQLLQLLKTHRFPAG